MSLPLLLLFVRSLYELVWADWPEYLSTPRWLAQGSHNLWNFSYLAVSSVIVGKMAHALLP
jgi:hypothetical protein